MTRATPTPVFPFRPSSREPHVSTTPRSGVLGLALGTALAFAAFAPAPAQACKCAPVAVDAAQAASAAIFEGRVRAIEDVPSGVAEAPPDKRVTLSVVRTWKGLANDEVAIVTTREASASCGYAFQVGESYLVYADGEATALQVNSCGRTRPVADADEDLKTLGAGITPVRIVPASDAGVADAGAQSAPTAGPHTGGCATGRASGTKSASLWMLGLPMLALATRRKRKVGAGDAA